MVMPSVFYRDLNFRMYCDSVPSKFIFLASL